MTELVITNWAHSILLQNYFNSLSTLEAFSFAAATTGVPLYSYTLITRSDTLRVVFYTFALTDICVTSLWCFFYYYVQAIRRNSWSINKIYIMSPVRTKGLLLITQNLGVISFLLVDIAPIPKKKEQKNLS